MDAGEIIFQSYCHGIEDGLSDGIAEKIAIEKYVNECGRALPIEADSAVRLAFWKNELARVEHTVVSPEYKALIKLRMMRMLCGVQEKIRRLCRELQVASDPGFIRRWGGRLGCAGGAAASMLNPLAYLPTCSGQKPKEKKD